MTKDAEQMMSAALKRVKLNGSFSSIELGARIGLDKARAQAAARWLSNAGVLELGYDNAAHFTRDFRLAQAPAIRKAGVKKKQRAEAK